MAPEPAMTGRREAATAMTGATEAATAMTGAMGAETPTDEPSLPAARVAAGDPRPTITATAGARRRRPPPARVSPEALAAARGEAREGLAWLGREPEGPAALPYPSIRPAAPVP